MKEGLSFDLAYKLVLLRLVEKGQMDECDFLAAAAPFRDGWLSLKRLAAAAFPGEMTIRLLFFPCPSVTIADQS